ncbi:MAG: (2Fe-2S)-binding protein [Shewanella psychromarinicola]|jgi:isoquinoline 1-oxidoreductase alpha subunit|uniref:(2Fe-2S)-binding protein n=1 Tax=Shewanella psychromarinicola TaxID=2487742 RepID=A0A3N4ECK2_9GAMM|nr:MULTISPECIES: (2Fe-2S)-binding protein [Shewanella]AZG36798.1 (2Fe-2S)-binding protein [Shewanella psychromarinicola]MCL1081083.1 (2Fe-2S)-binding protein [Shewanella psychromarinicola]PKG78040.1 (2Fe-2S)-binding protein [Shewanella sp. Actino-trap-3]RPA34652.1 (2Fe-2S)-binding protein [Shewanella psychromarinicola]|tara:strand:+ start:208549 stop:209001 length:453 start_codon:yes stop_codon:yes gene_type:complete
MTTPTQKLMVNGKDFTLDADPNMPVLWALRDILGLTGTKFGCGAGLCGACTIHVDGSPMRGCLTSLKQVQGKQVTTIEGLEAEKLKQAWLEHNVPQCGYCQAGQLMSAAALLTTTPKPTETQIADAMSGNICRCGTYPRIKAAIQSASEA